MMNCEGAMETSRRIVLPEHSKNDKPFSLHPSKSPIVEWKNKMKWILAPSFPVPSNALFGIG